MSYRLLRTVFVTVFMATALAAPETRAQDAALQPLLDRMERLERDIRLLNVQLARGADAAALVAGDGEVAANAPAMARLAVRLTTLEEDVRAMTGVTETLSHDIRSLLGRMDKLVGDVDYRLSALESAAGLGGTAQAAAPVTGTPHAGQQALAAPPGVLGQISEKDLAAVTPPGGADGQASTAATVPPVNTATVSPARVEQASLAPPTAETGTAPVAEDAPAEPAAPASILPAGSAQDQYAFSFGLLRKAEYAQAEQALAEFMATHGDTPLAHNAHYWLGETFYVRGQYARAAEVFLDAFQKTPTGAKAPDTLLKLGMSLANLDKKREACASFSKLMRDYPKASSAIKRTAERQIQQNGCQ